MDSQRQNTSSGGTGDMQGADADDLSLDAMGARDDDDMDGEEVEITREELVAALQEVVRDLSTGLKGEDRDAYAGADDLAQNDWFFAGVSDQEGTYSVTMWPAEGEEDMLRIDIGTEEDVHRLAENPEMVESMTDEFISAMEDEDDFDEDDEFEEYGDEDDEEDDEFEEEDEEMLDDEDMEDEETVSRDGNMPPR